MFAVAHNFSGRIPRRNRIDASANRTIGSFDLAATSRGDNRNPWKPLLVFVVSSTTRDTAVRGGLLRFSRMKINARPHRRVAARRTDRVAARRDISASRARAPCDSRAKNFGRTVDNKRSRRELQPVLVKITSPYDSRSSYGAHTRVIITGNDAAAHFGYSCFFQ